MSRAYRNVPGETRLDSFRDYDRTPSNDVHHGSCRRCRAETSRSVTVGPPGHPRNGFECQACGELFLREQFDRAPK